MLNGLNYKKAPNSALEFGAFYIVVVKNYFFFLRSP